MKKITKTNALTVIKYAMLSLLSCTALQAMQQQPIQAETDTKSNFLGGNRFFQEILKYMREDNTKAALNVLEQGLKQGLDVNTGVSGLGGNNMTLLHYALYVGNRDLVNALLRAGADPNAKNNFGDTPLVYAISSLTTELAVIQGLIKEFISDSRTNVNTQNWVGNTPLLSAIEARRIAALEALLTSLHIDVMIKNNKGQTAFDIVTDNQRLTPADKQKLTHLLKSHMTLKQLSLNYIKQNREKFGKQIKEKLPLDIQEQL